MKTIIYFESFSSVESIHKVENADQFSKVLNRAKAKKDAAMRRKDWNNDRKKKSLLYLCTNAQNFTDGHRHQGSAVDNGMYAFDNDDPDVNPLDLYNNKIRGREKALGIAFMENSFRGKTHIWAVRPLDMNVREAQDWLAEQLGISYDPAVSGGQAGFFLTGDVIYRDDELLFQDYDPVLPFTEDFPPQSAVDTTDLQEDTPTNDMSHVAPCVPTYKGVAYSSIYNEWERQHGGAPTEGKRNMWLYRCISAFKGLTGNDPGLLSSFIPRHGLPEKEFQTILRSALKTPAMGIWREMKEVLSTFKLAPSGWWRVDTEQIESLQKRVLKNLPIGLKDTLSCVPEDRKMNVLSALMPILGTYADQVSTAYFSNEDEEQKSSFQVGVVGKAGSGKTAVINCLKPWTKPLIEEAAGGEALIDNYKEKQETRKQNEPVKKPHPVIRYIAATASQSYVFEKLKYARNHCIYSEIHEISGLNSGTSGAWNELSEVLRLAFDWEHYQRGYTSKESVNFNGDVKWNLLGLGTPGAWWDFFGGRNMENGLSTRFLLTYLPDELGQKPASFKKMKDEQVEHIQQAIERLRKAEGFLPMRQLNKAMGQWAEGKRLLVVKYQDATLDGFYHRAAVIGFRCGLINHLLTGNPTAKETPTTIRMAQLMAEYALQGMLRLLGEKTEQLQSKYQLPQTLSSGSQWERILVELPREFTVEHIRHIRPDLNVGAINRAMQRRVREGVVTKIRNGEWRKH